MDTDFMKALSAFLLLTFMKLGKSLKHSEQVGLSTITTVLTLRSYN